MKYEVPQILWNPDEEIGKNAPLTSVSMIESGLVSVVGCDKPRYTQVLATAAYTNIINLWRLTFDDDGNEIESNMSITSTSTSADWKNNNSTKVKFLCSLTRHERCVNVVAFSPDGLHLATAGDGGVIIVWSVPKHLRGNGNGRHVWSQVERESDLTVKIAGRSGGGDEIQDLAWSADSKRFIAGTSEQCVFVYQSVQNGDASSHDCDWQVVYRNAIDHTHIVQGVAYDPLGVYLVSMSNDQSARVYPRKLPSRSQKKANRTAQQIKESVVPDTEHQMGVREMLADAKFEVGRSKQIKHHRTTAADGSITKQNYFCDEKTLGSFSRCPAWTSDGAYLALPCAVWNRKTTALNNTEKSSKCFATLLYARHHFDEPAKVLYGLEKPSICVRSNPVLFELPQTCVDECKENASPQKVLPSSSSSLPYRSIFAVLTHDTVLVYDTVHTKPLAILRGLHYSTLKDAVWSSDGHKLLVCSRDGYISIITFSRGELGTVYVPPVVPSADFTTNDGVESIANAQLTMNTSMNDSVTNSKPTINNPLASYLPPCEPEVANILQARPSKRFKRNMEQNIPTPPVPEPSCKRSATDDVHKQVDKLSLHEPKKKKRIQPTLIQLS